MTITDKSSIITAILQSAEEIEELSDLVNARDDEPTCLIVRRTGHIYLEPNDRNTRGDVENYHGINRIISVPQYVSTEHIAEWVRDNADLLSDLCEGMDYTYDGGSNRVGTMTQEAKEAFNKLSHSIESTLGEQACTLPTLEFDPEYMFADTSRELHDEPSAEAAVALAMNWVADAQKNHDEGARFVVDEKVIRDWATRVWQEAQ